MAYEDSDEINTAMGVKAERSMHVDVSTIGVPKVKNWRIGQEVIFTVKGTVKSLSEGYEEGVITACVTVPEPKNDE